MKHKHHIIPKHMGGTDDPENLIELTVEEHAEAHRVLYEKNGHWEDKLAWLGLSGQIGCDEAIFLAKSEGAKNRMAMGNPMSDPEIAKRVNNHPDRIKKSKKRMKNKNPMSDPEVAKRANNHPNRGRKTLCDCGCGKYYNPGSMGIHKKGKWYGVVA